MRDPGWYTTLNLATTTGKLICESLLYHIGDAHLTVRAKTYDIHVITLLTFPKNFMKEVGHQSILEILWTRITLSTVEIHTIFLQYPLWTVPTSYGGHHTGSLREMTAAESSPVGRYYFAQRGSKVCNPKRCGTYF